MAQFPDWYLSHFIQTPQNIIGFTLKPYSVWHYLHLSAINSPILSGLDPDTTMQDLETACFICSTEYGENAIEALGEYNKSDSTKAYREELAIHLDEHPDYLAREVIRFKSYQSAYEKPPTNSDFGEDELSRDKPSSELPWTLICIASAMKHFHYSERDAMNMPIGKLVTMLYADRYLETGESPILSEQKIVCLKLARGDIKLEDLMRQD